MRGKIASNASYFLLGLGIGSLVGILYAPKSGADTREYLTQRVADANESARNKAAELRVRGQDIVGRGKEVIKQTKEQITAAVEAGREAYQQELSKAKIA